MNNIKQNIMIMGGKGFSRNYGGWETFIKNLILNWTEKSTQFYVYEIVYNKHEKGILKYKDIICPQIYQKKIGNATMPVFCLKSLFHAIQYVKKNKLQNVIFYILGIKIGPIFMLMHPILKMMGIKVIINPDGLEWKRSKWNWLVKGYFLLSEITMLYFSNYIICDSEGIQSYIKRKYKRLKVPIAFISYGAYPLKNHLLTNSAQQFLNQFNIKTKEYYLIVGRFVPENNYELILNEFIKSQTNKYLLIISNYEKNKFYNYLLEKTKFDKDKRIIFAGTFYDKEGLESIRCNAYAYIHGHSAGGTNPSLLEAMSDTDLNILYDVVFNREVGRDTTLYFDNIKKPLSRIIDFCDKMSYNDIQKYSVKAKERIKEYYSWDYVVKNHDLVFRDLLNR